MFLYFFATEKPWKLKEITFYFIIKTLFVLKIFEFLSCLFGHVDKMVWLEREVKFQNLWRQNLVNRHLQYTCFTISYYQCSSHTGTSQLICCANQLTGFYMRRILVVKKLIEYKQRNIFLQKLCRQWGRGTLVELYKNFL